MNSDQRLEVGLLYLVNAERIFHQTVTFYF